MPKYYYVVDTDITNAEGVSVGQTTYDLLVDERLNHGVYPETTGPGAGTTWAASDVSGVQIGIHTTNRVGIGSTALENFNLRVHGAASFSGIYETLRPNDTNLSGSTPHVDLTVNGGNDNILIDVEQETVAIGNVGTAPQYDFHNVSEEDGRMCTVSVIGLGNGPGDVSAGNDYTINGGPVRQLTWATTSTPFFDSDHYNIMTFRILRDSVGLTSVFACKEGG